MSTEITRVELQGRHYEWPHLTPELSNAVEAQLHRSLSDRAADGIIGEFEEAFAEFVGTKYAVSFSSGTGALHCLARTALAPGEGIIAPAYTFFATASPFAFEGRPVYLADCGSSGNVTVDNLENAWRPDVRAVIVTHMWGVMCDMPAIRTWCDKRGLLLFEDCSHAHFGEIGGKRAGTWGDASVFSTNQKALTSGEGGVLCTDQIEFRDEALLFGHYNKRCKNEIDSVNSAKRFAFTGYGLKYRMHTLSAAVGVNQLAVADEIEARRRKNLAHFRDALAGNEVVALVDEPLGAKHGLYVLGLKFNRDKASLSREEFVRRLVTAGAAEMDVPGSTRNISGEPLFTEGPPHVTRPGRADEHLRGVLSDARALPGVVAFQDAFMKLPLWGYEGDKLAVEQYAAIIRASADAARG